MVAIRTAIYMVFGAALFFAGCATSPDVESRRSLCARQVPAGNGSPGNEIEAVLKSR